MYLVLKSTVNNVLTYVYIMMYKSNTPLCIIGVFAKAMFNDF